MFCKKCGKQIPDNSNACQYCGAMLTQRPVNSTYNQVNTNYQPQPKQQKKTPWKIIVSIVAIVVVIAIIISVVSCSNQKNEDRKRLLEVLEASTDKPVVEFIHEDFDSDGTTEAYAVVGESEKKEDYTEYYDADIYFVNQTEAEIIKESVNGHANGTIEVDDTIYVSLEVYDEDSDKGVSFVYTAEENKPVESDISGKYSDVHQDGGKILATDEDGNEIEVEITDGNADDEEEPTEPAEKFLEPTEEDWEEFEKYIAYLEYSFEPFDIDSPNALQQAYDFVSGMLSSDVYYYFYKNDGVSEFIKGFSGSGDSLAEEDPLGRFGEFYKHYAYPADRIDWIIKNVFNLTPDRTYSAENCYYYDDYFYATGGDGGGPGTYFKAEYEKLAGDKYKVNLTGYSYGDDRENYKIETTVALKEADGIRVWSFYKFNDEYLY